MNDRELAALIWFVVLAVWALSIGSARRSMMEILKALFSVTLLVPLGVMGLYVAGLIHVAADVGIWDSALMVDTIVWALLTGFMLFGKAVSVFTSRGSFKRLFPAAIGVTVFVEGFVNLYVFPLPVELLLLPISFLLGAMSAVAATKTEYALVKRIVDHAIEAIGFALLLYVAARIATDWHQFDEAAGLQKLALPMWLTLGTLPLVAILGLWSNYDTTFGFIRWASDDAARRRRARLALILGLHVRAREVSAFHGMWCKQLVRAETWSDAQAVVQRFRQRDRPAAAQPV